MTPENEPIHDPGDTKFEATPPTEPRGTISGPTLSPQAEAALKARLAGGGGSAGGGPAASGGGPALRAGSSGVQARMVSPHATERDDNPPMPIGELLRRIAKQTLFVALLISFAIHIAGGGLSAIWKFGAGGIIGDAPGAGDVEVATMSEGELDQLSAAGGGLDAPGVPDATANTNVPAPTMDMGVGDESAPGMGELSDIGAIGGGGDVGGVGSGLGGAGGGGGGASFFGVEASGNRFVFIVDVSGSMEYGGKIDELRRQLTRSITNLLETSEFWVIGFSDGPQPMGGKTDWSDGSATSKRTALRQVEVLATGGGTEPRGAFQMAFSIRPRPDAIYFMTDGEFDPNIPAELAVMNRSLHIPIHTICFATEASEALMKKIATESKGTYRFVKAQ